MRIAIGSMLCVFFVSLSLNAFVRGQDTQKQPSDSRREGMQLRAKATRITSVKDGQRRESTLVPQSLFHYKDEPRDILSGTLWAYGSPGRPVALQKIEVYRDQAKWFYCLTSLSEGLIETRWRSGERWSSRKPGLTFQSLADSPKAIPSAAGRLLQMKQTSRRFAAELFDEETQQNTRMRPLPRPLHRYSDLDRDILDGTLFGFATYGTNPDILLAIEMHRGATGTNWKYGLARMTLYKVTVKLDDKQVWQVPFAPWQGPDVPSKFDTWLFFHEATVDE